MEYYHWLILISLVFIVLERLFPWRKQQPMFRKGFVQDLGYIIINGHFLGVGLAFLSAYTLMWFLDVLNTIGIGNIFAIQLITDMPIWVQAIVVFFVYDFLQWCVHVTLHRVPFLWEFHKIHHSARDMDWIVSMRFHWMEVVVYRLFLFIPMGILGFSPDVLFWYAVYSTLQGHFNHSNLNIDIGLLKYVFNSPRMHIWHHEKTEIGRINQNYAINLSLWDWIFGTVYWPSDREEPEALGFDDIDKLPDHLVQQALYPVLKKDPV